MALFHVRSKVCMAPIHVRSKSADFAPHMDGSNADFAPRGRTWKGAMEWRHRWRDQKQLKLPILPIVVKNFSKPLSLRQFL